MKRVEKARVVVRKAKASRGTEIRRRKGKRKMLRVDDMEVSGIEEEDRLMGAVRRRRKKDDTCSRWHWPR